MKKIFKKFSLFILIFLQNHLTKTIDFEKVVLWGYKLHSHTNSYIHYAYHRAFKFLGYKTYWFDNDDNVANFDFSNTLFITDGGADSKIPINKTSFYILLNCGSDKYHSLRLNNHAISMQVYTHGCKTKDTEKLDNCIYCNVRQKIIYIPWATDLLPHEIEEQKKYVKLPKQKKYAAFLGTISNGGGIFSNLEEILSFKKACEENNISLHASGIYSSGISIEHGLVFDQSVGNNSKDHIAFIGNAYVAPALQGKWQCEEGYIPCRIFKNISYGALGITNSQTVWELFDKKIVYNKDSYQLFYDAQKKLETITLNEIYEQMDIVKEKHTYINRINTLLTFFDRVYRGEQKTNNSD